MVILAAAAVIIIAITMSYSVVAALTWIACMAFGIQWSWLLALGVWAVLMLLSMAFKSNGKR